MKLGKIIPALLLGVLFASCTQAPPSNRELQSVSSNRNGSKFYTTCYVCSTCSKKFYRTDKACVSKMQNTCRKRGLYYVGFGQVLKVSKRTDGKRYADISFTCASPETYQRIKKIYGR